METSRFRKYFYYKINFNHIKRIKKGDNLSTISCYVPLIAQFLNFFHKDLNLLYKLKEPLLHEGFDRTLITGSFTGGDTDTLIKL